MRHGTKTPYRDEFKIDKRDTDSRINRLQEGLVSFGCVSDACNLIAFTQGNKRRQRTSVS